jgi:hypothetical protein
VFDRSAYKSTIDKLIYLFHKKYIHFYNRNIYTIIVDIFILLHKNTHPDQNQSYLQNWFTSSIDFELQTNKRSDKNKIQTK